MQRCLTRLHRWYIRYAPSLCISILHRCLSHCCHPTISRGSPLHRSIVHEVALSLDRAFVCCVSLCKQTHSACHLRSSISINLGRRVPSSATLRSGRPQFHGRSSNLALGITGMLLLRYSKFFLALLLRSPHETAPAHSDLTSLDLCRYSPQCMGASRGVGGKFDPLPMPPPYPQTTEMNTSTWVRLLS